jgi:hypothetical protein
MSRRPLTFLRAKHHDGDTDKDSSCLDAHASPNMKCAADFGAEFDARKEIQILLAMQSRWSSVPKNHRSQQLGQKMLGTQPESSLPAPKRLFRTKMKSSGL